MGSLKGGTFEKQIVNAYHRLHAIGQRRHGTGSHKSHSVAVVEKRRMYLEDFAAHLRSVEIVEGKLNSHMSPENLSRFFEERLHGLRFSTQEDYLRGWSGMLQGLEQTRVEVDVDRTFFDRQVAEFRADAIDRGEDIATSPAPISMTFEKSMVLGLLPERSAVLAELQLSTGLRVSEAMEVVRNFDAYHRGDGYLEGIAGKGGQLYPQKQIAWELTERIMIMDGRLPSQSTYDRDLDEFEMNSHDWRALYIRDQYDDLIAQGNDHKEACRTISPEVNHRRVEIVEYYLAKTS